MKKYIYPILALGMLFTACKDKDKDPEPTPEEKAKIVLKLDHEFNGEALDFNTKYRNENGDTVKISELKYFISNLVLKSGDGELIIKDFYKLIQPTSGNTEIEIEIDGIDPKDYSSFSVSVGVDSARNHTIESAVGDLDPAGADQMIWTWSSGYKFVKFEGTYSMPDSSGKFVYHAGGDANYKVFDFGSTLVASEKLNLSLKSGKTTEIHLVVDLAEIFKSPNLMDVRKPFGHTGGATIMNNISTSDNSEMNGWFELHHIMTLD